MPSTGSCIDDLVIAVLQCHVLWGAFPDPKHPRASQRTQIGDLTTFLGKTVSDTTISGQTGSGYKI